MPQSAHGVSGLRCVVSGRVQGVFFRASTQEQARALGLNGYARNLPDGRVEILACGPDSALASLREWLHKGGPPHAEVHGLDCEPHTGPVPPGFAIK